MENEGVELCRDWRPNVRERTVAAAANPTAPCFSSRSRLGSPERPRTSSESFPSSASRTPWTGNPPRTCPGEELRRETREARHEQTSVRFFSAFFFFFDHVLSAVDIAQLLLPCSPPLCVRRQLSASGPIAAAALPPPPTLIISVSADLINRVKASDVFGFAFHDDGVTLSSSSCRQRHSTDRGSI